MAEAATASVVHVAAYADLCGGAIAFSCRSESQAAAATAPSSRANITHADYVLSAGELLRMQLPLTQLLVLSAPTTSSSSSTSAGSCADESGSHQLKDEERPFLVELLLNAGVRAVLLVKRPLPVDVLREFYTCFYSALMRPAWVSRALNEALAELRLDSFQYATRSSGRVAFANEIHLYVQYVQSTRTNRYNHLRVLFISCHVVKNCYSKCLIAFFCSVF